MMSRSLPLLIAATFVLTRSVFGLSVPVAEDATSTVANTITISSGAAPRLFVNPKQSAYIRFDLSDPAVLPAGFTPANITSATLRLYFVDVLAAGDLKIQAVTSAWTERPAGRSALQPSVDGAVVTTISSPDVLKKHFVTCDVTNAVKTAIGNTGNDFGFAVMSASTAKVVLASKEGPGIGCAAELEIEANLADDGSGDLPAQNLDLPSPTPTAGIIYSGTSTLLHAFGNADLFAGLDAGNLTTTGHDNVGVGPSTLHSITDGSFNTAGGSFALSLNASGNDNTAFGALSLFSNTAGSDNSAFGFESLYANSTGDGNTASGAQALRSNTTGRSNTAVGTGALYSNTTGFENAAHGFHSLYGNTTGSGNTASGFETMKSNTTGYANSGFGYWALKANTSGYLNTAAGENALGSNTTGNENIAIGVDSLSWNISGNSNVAVGNQSLWLNKGSSNTAVGYQALRVNKGGVSNTAVGVGALSGSDYGNNNIGIGLYAGIFVHDGQNNICIGNQGIPDESNAIHIGQNGTQTDTYIAGINGATAASGVAVYIDPNGRLGTLTSSQRYKDGIVDMGDASEAIFSLRPVAFHYKAAIDPAATPQFGLIAEEVEKVCPDLVAYDEMGRINTVRYAAVDAMLLNEFLKEHQRVKEQKELINEQGERICALETELTTLSKRLEEVAQRLDRQGLGR